MAEPLNLPPNSYQPWEPSLDRRQRRFLNPIIEEDSDDDHLQQGAKNQQEKRADAPHLKIEAWLSPMSDHFPTPRGVHYLAAPILPSSPSSVSADGSSPTNSSNLWNRVSVLTDSTEFEDLYDVSEEEGDGLSGLSRPSSTDQRTLARVLDNPTTRQPAPLIIPTTRAGIEECWSAVDDLKKITSPIPLTPSAKIPMSPAQRNFMGKQQALDVPAISAPPSLDGSLSSEQLAAMSSPPTPVIGDEESTAEETWTGVQLQPGALATLHALSSGDGDLHEQPDQVLEVPQTVQRQPLRLITSFRPQTTQGGIHSPTPTRQSFPDLTRLEVPSPGGFFSGLSPRTRITWHPPTLSPRDLVPPTSTTAEQFYRCPWNINTSAPPLPERPDSAEDFYRSVGLTSSAPIEHIVEVRADQDISDDIPTARTAIQLETANSECDTVESPSSPGAGVIPTEIVVECDPNYALKRQRESLANLSRTELWLLAQRAYLKVIDNTEEDDGALETIEESPEDEGLEDEKIDEAKPEEQKEQGKPDAKVKKTVRFSNVVIMTTAQPKSLPSKLLRLESAYYRAFQDYVVRTQLRDVFVHQLARFEALQAQRVALRSAHRNQLLGKYQLSVVPQSAKKRLSANVARGDDILLDDPEKLRKEKELDAMKQMTMATWHVAAMKFLNGGKLISAPVTKRLARLSLMAPGKDGVTRDRARILDLGGQSTCDWAWHCALQYPNTKFYTVTTKAVRQLSNSNIRGPPNHRQVAVERLTRLPFGDNQFDLVSARELHGLLKFIGQDGEDEWETCLRECLRVLKPGGYLEFSLLDSDIVNAGPLGLAKSVEFGFTLKTLGYDPTPTKLWLGRLARAGFQDIRRAWLCLPMGAKQIIHKLPTPTPGRDSAGSVARVCQMDAMVTGSTDYIANVCSIAGGWSWERWLLRCEMEKVAGELRLADTVTAGPAMREAGKCLEGVHAVIEEGRHCRAAFRMLTGYARKPAVSV